MTRTVAVTGATGFIGRALCRRLLAEGWRVIALTRSTDADVPPGVAIRPVGDLARLEDAEPVLADVDAVAHLAARVHVMRPTAADRAAFHAMNVTATRRLAEGARAAGVRRFLFMSSVKVHGEGRRGLPYTEADPPAPQDDYGRSKAEAEAALAAVPGLDVTVLRPPVVYGPGVAANIAALARLCDTPWPLPFGAVRNGRDLITLDNLVDAAARALEHPAAAGKTYLVRDGQTLSTADLVRLLRAAQGRPARLVPVPAALLEGALRMLGRDALADRLLGDFRIDDSRIRADLAWTAPVTAAEGLRRMVADGVRGAEG